MRRLLILAALAAVFVVAPPTAKVSKAEGRAHTAIVRVGFIDPYSPSNALRGAPAFWKRLHELGYVEGDNLNIEMRWAEGGIDRLPTLMAEVIALRVDVIVTYSTPAAIAAKKSTNSIPIVVVAMGDPIGTGLAASLARPGSNLTGLSLEMTEDLSGKWLELLQETVPSLSVVAVISNPESRLDTEITRHLQAASVRRGVMLHVVQVRKPEALASAVAQAKRKAQAALVLPDPLTVQYRKEIAALAAKHRLPAMYMLLDFMDSGGLMAYGVDNEVLFRRAAEYVDRILKGANPAELPIEQPTQFSLAVNLKAARALGITIPESILLRADEVIR